METGKVPVLLGTQVSALEVAGSDIPALPPVSKEGE